MTSQYLERKAGLQVLFGTIFLLSLLLGACHNDPAEVRLLTGKSLSQEDRASEVTFIYSKEGKIKMRVYGRDFVRNETAKPSFVDLNGNVKAEFFDDSGQIANTLTADSCRYYEAEGNVLVWDSVQIVSAKGQRLNTSELVWNQSVQKFFTEKEVRITTPTQVIEGEGMQANSDFSWYQIARPKGMVQVKKGELPQ